MPEIIGKLFVVTEAARKDQFQMRVAAAMITVVIRMRLMRISASSASS